MRDYVLLIKLITKYILFIFSINVMFLTIVLASESTAQYKSVHEVTISFTPKNSKIKSIFNEIESKTDFRFSYNLEDIPMQSKVDVSSGHVSIARILTEISSKTALMFRQHNNNISVGPKSIDKGERISVKLDVFAQVSGRVTDERGEPLPGVNVLISGTTLGTATDFDGNYRLDAPGDAILIFSFVGYATQEIALNGRSKVDVQLIPDLETLSEIVVIGYGEVNKRDLTGSVASIKSEDIVKVPTTRVDDALRGRIPGLQIVSSGGDPSTGDNTIRIRGGNSINAGNEPLIVIDGFIGGGNLSTINTNDIASIEVLKDASALAIYGARGANGVILITTKRGKAGEKPQVTYSSYVSTKRIDELLEPLGRQDYIDIQTISNPNRQFGTADTDWTELLLDHGMLTEHTLSATGGNENTQYYISGNFFSEESIVKEDTYKRFNLRLNLDTKISDRIKMGTTTSLTRITDPNVGIGVGDIFYDPTIPVLDDQGNFFIQNFTNADPDNPVSRRAQLLRENFQHRILASLYVDAEIIEGLNFKVQGFIDAGFNKSNEYNPSTLGSEARENRTGSGTVSTSQSTNTISEFTLNYNRTFDDHRIGALVGYTRQDTEFENLSGTGRNFATDAFTYNALGSAQNQPNLNGEGQLQSVTDHSFSSTEGGESVIESYLGRINYAFKDKYLLTISGRYDGSSNFAADQKRAFFPSAAFAWRLSDEPFMQGSSIIGDAKLRVSYGSVGNRAIPNFASLAQIRPSGTFGVLGLGRNFGYLVNGAFQTGLGPVSIDNTTLTWETTTSLDIGLDFGLFGNRIDVTLDYYHKTTKDLLFTVPIPDVTGIISTLRNFGEVRNTGVELSIQSVNMNRNGFKWETNFNIAHNRNKALSVPTTDGEILTNVGYQGLGQSAYGILREGEPVGLFYGLFRDGIWNDQAEIDAAPNDLGSNTGAEPGLKRWVDVNGDGFIDQDDRGVIGDPNPDFFGGIDNTFSYKRFDLSIFFQYSVGNDLLNFGENTSIDRLPLSERWSEDNESINVPSVRGVQLATFIPDSDWIEDGSFLRLRTLTFGYRLPVEQIDAISNARIYASATNLFTITGYSGLNPDVSSDGASTLARGFDRNTFPVLQTFTLGLNVTF